MCQFSELLKKESLQQKMHLSFNQWNLNQAEYSYTNKSLCGNILKVSYLKENYWHTWRGEFDLFLVFWFLDSESEVACLCRELDLVTKLEDLINI